MEAVGLSRHTEELARFWPGSGPRWDGLALLIPSDTVLLIEGKSYPAEMRGPGCTASDPDSLKLIKRSLEATKEWLGAAQDSDWLGPYYQFANRLAHVYFLREKLGIDARLVHLCFLGDTTTVPTDEETWRQGIPEASIALGLSDEMPFAVDVFLPAFDRKVLLSAAT